MILSIFERLYKHLLDSYEAPHGSLVTYNLVFKIDKKFKEMNVPILAMAP